MKSKYTLCRYSLLTALYSFLVFPHNSYGVELHVGLQHGFSSSCVAHHATLAIGVGSLNILITELKNPETQVVENIWSSDRKLSKCKLNLEKSQAHIKACTNSWFQFGQFPVTWVVSPTGPTQISQYRLPVTDKVPRMCCNLLFHGTS